MENKIAIVTDTNSGFTPEETSTTEVHVIPMPFSIDGEEYLEGVDLTQETFYEKLDSDADIKTSMPSLALIQEKWDMLLTDHDYVLYFPMSSELSGAYQAACMLAEDYNGKVIVIDTRRISVPQKQFVLDEQRLAKEGRDVQDIIKTMNDTAFDSVIFIALDTLHHLKKGGRITPTVATIGELLRIKPIMRFQGTKLDLFKTARTMKKAKSIMLEAIEDEIKNTLKCDIEDVNFQIAYSSLDDKNALSLKEELQAIYPHNSIHVEPLTLSLSCHIGPRAVGIACTKNVK